MTSEDELLAATHDRMKAMLDFYFPNEKAESALTPSASVLKPNPPAREDKAEQHEL